MTLARERKSETYEESRNVICFNCQKKEHYANECSNSRQSRKMRSSSITAQTILSQRSNQDHLADCVLSDQMIAATIRSEEIRKKEAEALVKKKRMLLKRNERINEEHVKYVKNQEKKQEERDDNMQKMNFERTTSIKKISRLNQYEEFHDFKDDEDEVQMMKYLEEESVLILEKTQSKEKTMTKMKVTKEQMKKLMMSKKLKISNSIKTMRNRERFDI